MEESEHFGATISQGKHTSPDSTFLFMAILTTVGSSEAH